MIIIVFGLPGSGKSYFAERLASTLKAAYLNSDVVRRQMFEHRTYRSDETKAVYQHLLDRALAVHNKRKTAVVDASFHDRNMRGLFQDADPSVQFIEITATEALILERLSKPRFVSEADADVYHQMKKQWQPFLAAHLVLNSTDTNVESMLAQASNYLRV